MGGRIPISQLTDLLCNAGLPGVDMYDGCTIHSNAYFGAGISTQHGAVVNQKGFHTFPGGCNGSRHTTGASAGNDHIILSAILNCGVQTLDPSPVFVDAFDFPGWGVVKVVGNQDGSTAAEITGQVMECQRSVSGFQLVIAGNFPHPGIGGHGAQRNTVVPAVYQKGKCSGIVWAIPVSVPNPDPVSVLPGNIYGHCGILYRYAGNVGGNEITAAHQMDKLGIFFPAALLRKVSCIDPNFCDFLHRPISFH